MHPQLLAEREVRIAPAAVAPRRLVILGATGSIGRSTADVIEGAIRIIDRYAIKPFYHFWSSMF